MSRRHRRRAGRKRKVDPAVLQRIADSSPTVRAAMRRPEVDRGTPELRAHRRHAEGERDFSAIRAEEWANDHTPMQRARHREAKGEGDYEKLLAEEQSNERKRVEKKRYMPNDKQTPMLFPLAVMRARQIIDVELHDAGMRFAALSWALFGEPFAGCEALYERMVGSTDRSPIGEADTERAAERRAERQRLHARMLNELQRRDPVLEQPIESGRMRRIVADVCQYAHMPRWLVVMIESDGRATGGKMRYRLSDAIERGLLIEGLSRLAAMERQRSPRRAA